MIFWLIAAAMLIAALAVVLLPLLRPPKSTGPDQDAINLAVYRERLAELQTEARNGALTPPQYEQARAELERQAAADLGAAGSGTAPAARSVATRWTAALVGVVLPAVALGLYLRLGDLQAPSRASGAASEQAAVPGMHSFDEAVDRLAAKLAANPRDGEGWLMLARSYVMLKRYGEAGLAFTKAVELLGRQPDLLADYAEALALANNNSMLGQPAQLVFEALKSNPNHPKSLWLVGHALIQQGRPAEGIGYWRRLLAQLPPDAEGRATVEQLIAQVQASNPQLAAAPPAPAASAPPTAAAPKGASLAVRVQLAPALAAKAAPTDTVFVFARAAQGPRMPLAIVRSQVKDLPVTVTLDDSMAMSPAMKLSGAAQVVVGARVSKSGTATPQSGDLEGLSAPLPPTIKETVVVTIGSIVP